LAKTKNLTQKFGPAPSSTSVLTHQKFVNQIFGVAVKEI
jgi:hypothetical protein